MSNIRVQNTGLKYKVLKSHLLLKDMPRCFQKHCDYQLATLPDMRVRKYKMSTEFIDKVLQVAEWRHNMANPVVHCFFLKLLSPTPASKKINIQIPLQNLKKLILNQALYLVIEAVKAYQLLLEKFKEVSVSNQTFGLTASGLCVSWLSSHLQLSHCQQGEKVLKNSLQITEEIIRLVKIKSEPICQLFLSKIQEGLDRNKQCPLPKKISFSEILTYLANFANINKVKLPLNLKYLVNQKRLFNNLYSIRSKNDILNSREAFSTQNRTMKQFNHDQQSCKKINSKSPIEAYGKPRKSLNNYYPTLRKTIEQNQKNNANIMVNSQNNNLSMGSSRRKESFSLKFQTIRKIQDSFVSKNQGSSSSNSKIEYSSCKSQSFKHNHLVNKIKTIKLQTTRSSQNNNGFKKHSGISDNAKTAGSIFDPSKKSETDNSMVDGEINCQTRNKSIIGGIPCRILQNLSDTEQYESHETSPYNNKQQIAKQSDQAKAPLQMVDPLFNIVLEQHPQKIIKANEWVTTIRNLTNGDTKLHKSIIEGQDFNNYLSDVRLEKLDGLTRQMVVSLIPHESKKQLNSDHRCITESQ